MEPIDLSERPVLRTVGYDHPDAVALVTQLQEFFRERYGDIDHTKVDPAEFAPPRGRFLVAYIGGVAVGCGGWRVRDDGDPDLLPGDGEIKRMFVVPSARGRGLSRLILAELERTAAEAGARRLVLETGDGQPEAIGLYTSSGYTPIRKFGIHRHAEGAFCYGKPLVRETARNDTSELLNS